MQKNYSITRTDLNKALNEGRDVTVIINGEYYDIKPDKKDYLKELKAGYAVTIISPKKNYVPTIFWLDRERKIVCWNPCIGTVNRNDMDYDRLLKHFSNMEKEGCQLIISGLVNEL